MKRFLSACTGIVLLPPLLATFALTAAPPAAAAPSPAPFAATLTADQASVKVRVPTAADSRNCAVVVWVTRPGTAPLWRLAGFTTSTPTSFTVTIPSPATPGPFTVSARSDCSVQLGTPTGPVLATAALTRVFAAQPTPAQVYPDAFDAQLPRRAEVRVNTVPGAVFTTVVTRPDGTTNTLSSTKSEVAAGTHKVGASSRLPGRWRFAHTIRASGRVFSLTQVVRVHRSWAPLALVNGRPVAFASCSLTYAYDDSSAPPRTRHLNSDIERAFSSTSRASGITFTPAPVKKADIVLRFSQLKDFPPSTAALGGASWVGNRIDAGVVRISATHPLMRTSSPSRRAVLIHELGHVLGLGHVRVKEALMYPTTSTSSPLNFTPLDRTGLKELYGACQ